MDRTDKGGDGGLTQNLTVIDYTVIAVIPQDFSSR